MKPRQYRLAWTLLLLLLPVAGWALGDLSDMLWGTVIVLLAVLAGLAAIIAALVATIHLLRQLGEPEPADPAQRQPAGLRLAGLTLPASAVAWALIAGRTYDPRGSWYYPAVPLALLLGLATCLLLWWRQRPTAAAAVLGGLLVAGAGATTARWLQHPTAGLPRLLELPAAKPPMPLGLLGNPIFQDATFPADSVMVTADTSYVYTNAEYMPGFRGGSTRLKVFVNRYLRYPEAARRQHLTGVVQVSFVVQPNGHLTKFHINTPLSPACDQEALRMLSLLDQQFSPGLQNGRPVPVAETLSFGFGPTAKQP